MTVCDSPRYHFRTLMCLTGDTVDPLVMARTLFYNFVEYHIIGNDAVEKALERCAESSLLRTTSVHVWSNGTTLTLEGAKLSLCPNGTVVTCPSCVQPAVYHKQRPKGGALVFRCKRQGHEGVNFWDVLLVQGDAKTKVVEGKCRCIIRSSEAIFI
jgi:hypothetical protein